MKIRFYTGDAAPGWPGHVELEVDHIAQFPRGQDGTCAFCHGDPCAENSPPDSQIAQFFRRNRWAETCPCCEGRPT